MILYQLTRWFVKVPFQGSFRWLDWQLAGRGMVPFSFLGTFGDLGSSLVQVDEPGGVWDVFMVTCYQCYILPVDFLPVLFPFPISSFVLGSEEVGVSGQYLGHMTRVNGFTWKIRKQILTS